MDIDMDIKELEAFVYVVENCSFSRAAGRLIQNEIRELGD